MKDDRQVKYLNEDGMMIIFGSEFSPFLLNECEGIYMIDSNVATSENTMTDGATYQGSNIKMRNIVLTISAKEDHMRSREKLYRLFKPKSPGTFIYKEGGVEKQIECYVEKVDIGSKEKCRKAIISLLCPDPYFESPSDVIVEIANWESLFKFAFEIPEEGIEFGNKSTAKLKTIENDCADYTGVEIVVNAEAAMRNPTIYHVESGEYMKVGTESKPLILNAGEKLVITTHTNNKHIYLEKNDGIKTEINGYMDVNSEFIQLRNGKNSFGYSAEMGEEYMSVVIKFKYKYTGV